MRHITLWAFTAFLVVAESRVLREQRRVNPFSSARRWERWCTENIDCGRGLRRANMCRCPRGYITWTLMQVCQYRQRTKLAAFLLSFFLGIFGIDWFVLSRANSRFLLAGTMKLLLTIGCAIGWPTLIIIVPKTKSHLVSILTGINVLLTVTSFVWWLTDWVRILANVFSDGHGAPLQAWQ